MKLAVYYVLVSAVFAGLAVKAPDVAKAAIVAFIAMLLVPAVYAEFLRIRRS